MSISINKENAEEDYLIEQYNNLIKDSEKAVEEFLENVKKLGKNKEQ